MTRTSRDVAAFVAAVVIASLSSAKPARADEVTDLLEQGVALRRQHRTEEALDAFLRAARLSPAPAILAQVGLAEQALGRWIEAAHDLDVAVAAADDPWIAKNLDALHGAQAIVAQHVAWLTVDVDVASAEIGLDGVGLERGIAARVSTGPAVLEVRAPGYAPDIRHLELAPAEHARIAAKLVPLSASASLPSTAALAPVMTPDLGPPRASAPTSTAATSLPLGPLVLGGAGLVALGTGTYFGIRTLTDKSNRDGQCVGGCNASAVSYDSDARTSATISTVALAGGGAMVVASGLWWWLGRGASAPSARGAVDVAPVVGSGFGGIVAWGSL